MKASYSAIAATWLSPAALDRVLAIAYCEEQQKLKLRSGAKRATGKGSGARSGRSGGSRVACL